MTLWKLKRKPACLSIAVLMIALSANLHAQTILGTWQGMLPLQQPQRIVLKIAKTEDGSLRGTLTFIDRTATGNPVPKIVYTAPDLSFELGGISYRGKMSDDGKLISGTWTLGTPTGNQTFPATLALSTPETMWTGPAPLPPMAATADPAFEVATIKPSQPGGGGVIYSLQTRRFQGANLSATELIKIAYNVRGKQVDGGPSWKADEKFDVVADPDMAGQPSPEQVRAMVRKLLEERFGLKVHMSQREFSVFALTVETSPPKLTKSDPAGNTFMTLYTRQAADGQLSMQFANATMVDFVGLMMNFVQSHMIVDETGLKGRYDFAMTMPTSALHEGTGLEDDPDTVYAKAVQQLGMKFVPKKLPMPIIVIDHLDRPTAN
jgi:uncharacterized protein (TIGR03435 family)